MALHALISQNLVDGQQPLASLLASTAGAAKSFRDFGSLGFRLRVIDPVQPKQLVKLVYGRKVSLSRWRSEHARICVCVCVWR